MKPVRIKLIVSIAIPAIFIAGVCVWWPSGEIINEEALSFSREKITAENIIPVNYNWSLYYAAIGRYPSQNNSTGSNVVGVIVPHHDLAADYTAELFQKIGKRNIQTLIIIGPNHENSGAGDIITGLVAYTLPQYQVYSSSTLVAKLLRDKIAVADTGRLQTEHSIYNIVPYVNYYFPEARIVPIILSGRVTLSQAKNLGKYLASFMDEQTLIIGSIDFSHYLPTEKANANDLITQGALISRDYDKIYSFDNDNVDSPPTTVVVLAATELVGAPELEIVRNANQAEAMGASSVPSSTSYFTILMRR